MATIHSICVYCGSGGGHDPAYLAAARTLGAAMAKGGIRLVYGGGGTGMMGEVARAVLQNGGEVVGIIPDFLKRKEVALEGIQEQHIVPDMHVRKMMMFEKADAFVALPGGIGTLEELIEQLTWAQLGRHRKPVVIANVAGFWDPLKVLLTHMRQEGFIRPELAVKYTVIDEIEQVIPAIQAAVVDLPEGSLAETSDPFLIGKL